MLIKYSDETQSATMPDSAERAAMVVRISGNISLGYFKYPLPEGLEDIYANIDLSFYKHPLPKGLKRIWGDVNFGNYGYPLPEGLKTIGGQLYLRNYCQLLPPWIISAGETPDGQSCYAIRRDWEWRIYCGNKNSSLHDAVEYWKNYDGDVSILVNLLVEQIYKSPLKR